LLSPGDAALWVLAIVLAVLAYEVLRSLVLTPIRRAQERRVDRFLADHQIPADPFRHTHRVVVKELVLSDPDLVAAMAERAKSDGTGVAQVQHKVRAWLDEIVPQFNLLAYYQVGVRLARLFAYGLYNVRLDKESWEAAQAKIPKDAAVVLVSNHRSNADFVVTGFMVSKSVQVSYAVGEWARVWPLERLFKSFGSYFVRRGEKDPLYHRTLDAYVQLVTKQGGTQAVFPEGGLSRDGKLRPAKLGLLDSMARAKRDPAFRKPLVFLPVGINFDRVLEDEILVRETLAGDHPLRRRSPGQKARRVLSLVGRIVWTVPSNLVRLAAGRLKKHGVCAIHFGAPIVFDDWLAQQVAHRGPILDNPSRHARHDALQPFADRLMAGIARTIPVTPVPLTCLALTAIGPDRLRAGVDRGGILLALRAATDRLSAAGAPFFAGNPYRHRDTARTALERDAARPEHVPISLDIEAALDLEETLGLAMDVLGRRRLLVAEAGVWRVPPPMWPLVQYYANSLGGHLASTARTPLAPVAAATQS
jgi:glycerol-3-phosphate O-acyltransferase